MTGGIIVDKTKESLSIEFVMLVSTAITTGKITVGNIEYYAALGADVNCQDVFEESVLHTAASLDYTDTDIIDALIAAGADVNLKCYRYGQTPLHYAAKDGSYTVIRALILAGADINAKDNEGNTPLMYLAQRSWMEEIGELIDGGADLSIRNNEGHTAFDLYKERCKDNIEWFETVTNSYTD